jgi:hypothetical protein
MPQNNKNMENKFLEFQKPEKDFESLREVSWKTKMPYKTLCLIGKYLDDICAGKDRHSFGISEGIRLIYKNNFDESPIDIQYNKKFVKKIVTTAFMVKNLKNFPL